MGTQGSKYTRVRSLDGDEAMELRSPVAPRSQAREHLTLSSLRNDLLIAHSLHGIPAHPISEVSTTAMSLGRPPIHGAAGPML